MSACGVEPNTVTYTSLISACLQKGLVDEAVNYLTLMRSGTDKPLPNVITYNTVLVGLCNCGHLSEALRLYKQMSQDGVHGNLRTFNVLINGCSVYGDMPMAEALLLLLQQADLVPDVFTYTSLMKGYAHNLDTQRVSHTWETICVNGVLVDLIVVNSYMHALVRCGKLGDAELVLGALQHGWEGLAPDVISYSCVISELVNQAKWDRAVKLYLEMRSQGVYPDVKLLQCLMEACKRDQQWELLEYWWQDAVACGFSRAQIREMRKLLARLVGNQRLWRFQGALATTSAEIFQKHQWNRVDSSFRPL